MGLCFLGLYYRGFNLGILFWSFVPVFFTADFLERLRRAYGADWEYIEIDHVLIIGYSSNETEKVKTYVFDPKLKMPNRWACQFHNIRTVMGVKLCITKGIRMSVNDTLWDSGSYLIRN